MCSVVARYNDVRLYFQYGGSGAQLSTANFNENRNSEVLSASVTKVVTVYMMMELLAANEGRRIPGSPMNYRPNGWNLDTKIRIVADPSQAAMVPGTIYMGPGFASSTCMPGGGWAGIQNIAGLSLYTPETGYQYSIRQLIEMAMAPSFNDAAVVLGALVTANLDDNYDGLWITQPMPAGASSGAHEPWLRRFRDYQQATANFLLGGSGRTRMCNPPGWAATATGHCSGNNTSTAEDWVKMASSAYRNIAHLIFTTEQLGGKGMETLFAPFGNIQTYRARLRDGNGTCVHMVDAMVLSTSRYLMTATGSAQGIGPIKLIKSGTVDAARNLIAVAEPGAVPGVAQCSNQQMVAVVLGLPRAGGPERQGIIANMLKLGREHFTQGNCPFPLMANVVLPPLNGNMTAQERSVAQANYVNEEIALEDISLRVAPDPQPNEGGEGGVGPGAPSGNISGEFEEQQCAEEFDLAQQWAEQLKATTNFGMLDAMMDSRVDEIFSQQCIGKIVSMMQDLIGAVDTVRQMLSSADMMQAIVGAAAGAIVRAIMDQIFNSLTNVICNVTEAITNAIDNVSRNLLCFKKPLFSVSNDPFRIPIDIDDIECSGIAINPLYFSNDPNQPLASGSLGQFNLDGMRSGDRPFYCGVGYRAVPAEAGAANANQSMGQSWTCVRDPNYQPPETNVLRRRVCYDRNNARRTGWISPDDGRCIFND